MKWQAEANWRTLVTIEKLARQEVLEDPLSIGRWTSLIYVQKRLGRPADVEASLDRAQAVFAADEASRKNFLKMLLDIGEGERALLTAEALIETQPDDSEVQAMLARAVVGLDSWTDHTTRAFARIAHTPHAATSHNQAFRLAKTEDDLRAFVARCRAALETAPTHTDARCFLAHALARVGDEAEARSAMSLDALVSICELPVPAGYASAETFRTALAAEIRRNPTLAPDPKNKATREGLQTAALGLPDEPAVAALMSQIKAAAEAYADARTDLDDPFITAAPAEVRITQWAVIYGAGGRQTSHRHPAGWLSGVYYVSAPRAPAGDAYLGSLLVGEPITQEITAPPWGIRRVEPLPGRLVLFPSFVSHGAEACGVDGERISLAFDIMPAEPAGS